MHASSLHRRIISGEAGLWAAPLRLALQVASTAYSVGVKARNDRFDRGQGVTEVSAPVISVGNITVGGTGKTPMVIDLVQKLQRRKRTPAIIARGYKAQDGRAGDEELLIRRRAPGACYIANPNRTEGATEAIREGANVVVLDDGFQHRALARDLDIVLIDATCPFGFDHVLPRGLLREPVQGLRRANVLIVTRCDAVAEEVVADIHARLAEQAPGCSILSCSHKPVSIARVDGTDLSNDPGEFLAGKNVLAFSGLAQPQAFEQTVSSLGATVVAARRWPDHHSYSAGEVRSMLENANDIDLCVTSEKDAVKLAKLAGVDLDRIAVVQVAIDFAGEDGTILDALLDQTLRQSKQQ
jgi:tetraacyldisaccharide 4'-kinase